MLFSEPKIPQFLSVRRGHTERATSFSALQRAENSSICRTSSRRSASIQFQCSSASRKFLNSSAVTPAAGRERVSVLFSEPKIPQSQIAPELGWSSGSFSALQRAENSSIRRRRARARDFTAVSVLFSEPKIPQSIQFSRRAGRI